VYLICRGDHPIIVYDANGRFLRSWGQGEFTYRTHGISVGPDEMLYCTDDGNHTIRKFTPDGKLLMTLGTMNTPSDTGYDGKDSATVTRGPLQSTHESRGGPGATPTSPSCYGKSRGAPVPAPGELKRPWGTPAAPRRVLPAPTASRGRGRARLRVMRE
jgi:hypothetical protein